MTDSYFLALATRCRAAARDCLDPYAKEEFRRLANEFEARAHEPESPAKDIREQTAAWRLHREQPMGFAGDH